MKQLKRRRRRSRRKGTEPNGWWMEEWAAEWPDQDGCGLRGEVLGREGGEAETTEGERESNGVNVNIPVLIARC